VKIGLLLDNVPLGDTVPDSSIRKLTLMRATCVGTLWTAGTKHRREVYERCEAILQEPEYLVRVGGHRQTPGEWLDDAAAAACEMPEGARRRSFAVVGNEPNIEGWVDDPEGYGRFYRMVTQVEHEAIFACPSIGVDGWEEYLRVALYHARPVRHMAVNLYDRGWQWIERIRQIWREFHSIDDQARIYVTELNTLRPDRVPWLRSTLRQLAEADVEACTLFIAGGRSNGAWDERYIIDEQEAAEIGQLMKEDTVSLRQQFPEAYAQWEREGGPENNFRKHALALGLIAPTAKDIHFLAAEARASLDQLQAALAAYLAIHK